jgi:hypothetical protein
MIDEIKNFLFGEIEKVGKNKRFLIINLFFI